MLPNLFSLSPTEGKNKLECLSLPKSFNVSPIFKTKAYSKILQSSRLEPSKQILGCHDTPHNDIQHNDTQYYDTQHYDIQHNDTQHNNIQHNDTQQNAFQHNNKLNATLSIVAFFIQDVIYAACCLC